MLLPYLLPSRAPEAVKKWFEAKTFKIKNIKIIYKPLSVPSVSSVVKNNTHDFAILKVRVLFLTTEPTEGTERGL